MKRLWIALVLLGAVFTAVLWNGRALTGLTGELTGLLAQAGVQAGAGDWAGAGALTRRAQETWTARDGYLHIMLRHGDTDEIDTGFQETLAYLACRDEEEYAAANARLIARLERLSEAEQLTWNNVLSAAAGDRCRRVPCAVWGDVW